MTEGLRSGEEQRRLRAADAGVPWRRRGPYASDRQWGAVSMVDLEPAEHDPVYLEQATGWTGLAAVFPQLFAVVRPEDIAARKLWARPEDRTDGSPR